MWLASISTVASFIGTIVTGPIMDRYGRRLCLLYACIPFIVGWLLISIQPTMFRVFAGRLITGIGAGMVLNPSIIYVAEVTTPEFRGLFIVGRSISITIGILMIYVMGLIFKDNWQCIGWICTAIPATSAILVLCFLPESHTWLVSKGKYNAAARSMARFQGKARADDQIFKEIELMIQNNTKCNAKKNSTSFWALVKDFRLPEVYKPLFQMVTVGLSRAFSGYNIVLIYAIDFIRTAGIRNDAYVIATLIGVARLVGNILCAYCSKRFGRRQPVIMSGCIVFACLLVLAGHTYYANSVGEHLDNVDTASLKRNISELYEGVVVEKTNSTLQSSSEAQHIAGNRTMMKVDSTSNVQPSALTSVVPILALLIYTVGGTVYCSLPTSMAAELFPTHIKGLANSMTSSVSTIILFICLKWYPSMASALGNYGTFILLSVSTLVTIVLVIAFLPETQGKTLAEIEELYTRKDIKEVCCSEEVSPLKKSSGMPVFINLAESIKAER